MPLPFYKLPMDSHIFLMFGLHELSVLDIHLPSALIGLLLRFTLIDALSVLLAICEPALVGVSVSVNQLSLPINLVVLEATLIGEGVPALRKSKLALPVLLSFHKIALV